MLVDIVHALTKNRDCSVQSSKMIILILIRIKKNSEQIIQTGLWTRPITKKIQHKRTAHESVIATSHKSSFKASPFTLWPYLRSLQADKTNSYILEIPKSKKKIPSKEHATDHWLFLWEPEHLTTVTMMQWLYPLAICSLRWWELFHHTVHCTFSHA